MIRFYNHQCNFKVFIKREHTHTDFFKSMGNYKQNINNSYLWVIEPYLIFFFFLCKRTPSFFLFTVSMDILCNLGNKYVIPLRTETMPKMLSALGKI